MSWFDKILPPGLKRSNSTSRAKQVPEGLWVKCPACDAVLYSTELEKNLNVCPKCEHHMRLRARLRLERLLDTENRKELGQDVRPVDALKFKDSRKYTDRLSQAASASGETDALVVTALDIGQGSMIVVEQGERRLLYDTGASRLGGRSAIDATLVPWLNSRGLNGVDVLVVSHLDAHHAGGAARAMAALNPSVLLTAMDPRLLGVGVGGGGRVGGRGEATPPASGSQAPERPDDKSPLGRSVHGGRT